MKIKTNKLNECGIAHFVLIFGVVLVVVLVAGFWVVQRNEHKNVASTSRENATDTKDLLKDATNSVDGIPMTNNQSMPGQATPTEGVSNNVSTPSTSPKSSPIQGTQQNTGTSSGSNPSSSGSTSTPVTSTDGDTPQVALTYPSYWGQTVSGTITITATASDSSGIQKVVFMIRRIGYATAVYTQTDTTAPYSAAFDTTTLPNGGSEYTVEAQAFDNTGKGNMASHRINIQN